VYVVANEYSTTSSYNYLTLWKNNTKTLISQNTYGTALNSLAINGTDIYITGSLNYYSTTNSSQAALWKNGNLIFIYEPATANISAANTVAINNSTVYVAGYSNNNAAYWTSTDNFFTEHDLAGSSSQYTATSMAFNNSDMYVAGYQITPTLTNAVYWKNGTLVNLLPVNSSTSGIGIVQY
jgi:hypothetical protein